MKKNNARYAIYDGRESLKDSIYKDIVTFTLLSFSIYISHDSKFWTFVTGLMFIFYSFHKLSIFLERNNLFHTKRQIKEWVDSLPDDENKLEAKND